MLSSARPGIRATPYNVFDPLLIDNFNRPDGALGTAYNGQAWSTIGGTPVISTARFTSSSGSSKADIPMPGAVGNVAISVDCDPGSSALGDQAYMVVDFFKDPATSECYQIELSERNWFFIYFNSVGTQIILTTGSLGYTYSTPFRLYITAEYIGGVMYYQIDTSNLTGGPHTTLTKGSYWNQVTNGSHLQLRCNPTQFFDNLRNTTTTLPVVSFGNLGINSSFISNLGSTNMLLHYTVASNGGSASPQHWGVSQLRTNSSDFTQGYRYQWADSTAATDYIINEDAGERSVDSIGFCRGLGDFKFMMQGSTINFSSRAGVNNSTSMSDPTIDANTYLGVATTARSTVTNITAMPL
ncbi:MAG TPA: hypothetical protein VG992_01905 [Candidatus Saccharimonadales bacterium]|nr:hypothetical protein [Candidatus Saccharimonadales bacterium]